MSLYIVEKELDGVTVLDLRGRITLGEETETLRDRLMQLVEAGRLRIILNLEEVRYIDSVGVSTLVKTHTAARRKGGVVKLLHLTKNIRGLLQITRISTVFDVYDTLQAARDSFGHGSQA